MTLVTRNNLVIVKLCTILSGLHLKYKLFFNYQCLECSILISFIELWEQGNLGKSKLESRTFKAKAQIWKYPVFTPLLPSLHSSVFTLSQLTWNLPFLSNYWCPFIRALEAERPFCFLLLMLMG